MDPSAVVLELTNTRSGWEEFLNLPAMRQDWIELIVKILEKALQCQTVPNLEVKCLAMIRQSKFLEDVLVNYILRLLSEKSDGRLKQLVPTLKSIMTVLHAILERMPSSYVRITQLVAMLELSAKSIRTRSAALDDAFNNQLEELTMFSMTVQSTKVQHHSDEASPENEGEMEPPEDFTELDIFPTADDIRSQDVFLRHNLRKGAFADEEHYLDVQFRLIREDFIRPLRDGIRSYLDSLGKKGKRERNQNVRIYSDVRILHPVATDNGVSYVIQFDVSRFQRLRWESSRRLIFGSLVCLSSDNFETLYFASVSDRDLNHLREGRILVRFERDQDRISEVSADTVFVMAETTAYFEAYRHVLLALQEFRTRSLPFPKHLLGSEDSQSSPKYLRGNARRTVDFTPIMKGAEAMQIKQVERSNDRRRFDPLAADSDSGSSSESDTEDFDSETKLEDLGHDIRYSAAPVSKVSSWPNAKALGLDNAQHEALLAALTREFAIIQGPPGTGKTFMGLKIAKFLLHNRELWSRNDRGQKDLRPILVVCYTNHALDQFLEGVAQFHDTGIVRVGGRSKNESMKKYLLRNLKLNVRQNRAVPAVIFERRHQCRNDAKTLREQLERGAVVIDAAEKGLLALDVLNLHMSDQHYQSLCRGTMIWDQFGGSQGSQNFLMMWLGVGAYWVGEEAEDTGGPTNPEDAADEDEGEGEDAAVEQEKRQMDDDEDFGTRLDREERIRQLQALEDSKLAVKLDDLEAQTTRQDGPWRTVGPKKGKIKQQIKRELISTDVMPENEEDQVVDVWKLNRKDKWRLYRLWLSRYKRAARDRLTDVELRYQRACDTLKEVRDMEDQSIMRDATVIGMTTTCAARYRRVLADIKPKIVIVEEAAEVLEAHVLASLHEDVEHLILIGDHKQLRPSANVYELAVKYNLELSMFERMVINGLDCKMLEEQHRMRPDIADNLRYIYPDLRNHPSVEEYEHLKGVSADLFFISHNVEEAFIEDSQSRSNDFEARYLAALCRHLVLQGYQQSQITVLAPYTGQVFLLKRLFKKDLCKDVRITAVDNFQGEENDIILLSLVRSNTKGEMGFLKVENRMCVALSRARKGMYVIGNFAMLEKHNEMWSKIVRVMRDKKRIGPGLQLACQKHPNNKVVATKPEDFNKAPEGGCMEKCEARLLCGHSCRRPCHIVDSDHQEYECRQPCANKCPKGHPCKRRCFQECDDCEVPEQKKIPRCGHTQQVPCYLEPSKFLCKKPCTYRLKCGHTCARRCGDDHTQECLVKVTRTLHCGHSVSMACYNNPETYPCPVQCKTTLGCGHPCAGSCSKCFQGRLHISCKKRCGRTLVCSHECTEPCTKDCPPCLRHCENRCVHSECWKKCGEPCTPCKEACNWECSHYKCTMLCSEPCNRPKCNKACRAWLDCDHRCIGMCGEPCPSKCRVCDKEEVTEIFFGTEDEPNARFVELEDCGHVVEVTGMDRYMELVDDANNIKLKTCPRCSTPIRRNLRYGKAIKRCLNDIELVKQQVFGALADIGVKTKEVARKLLKEVDDDIIIDDLTPYLKNHCKSLPQLGVLETQVNILVRCTAVRKDVEKLALKSVLGTEIRELDRLREHLQRWCLLRRNTLSDFERDQVFNEVRRLSCMLTFTQLKGKLHISRRAPQEIKEEVEKCGERLRSCPTFTQDEEETVKALVNKVKATGLLSDLGITEQERVQIIGAIGLSKGHWYKCPKGHIYAIGDCGGPNEGGTCPECKSAIGGQSHGLATGNQHAGEMDGSRFAAYSEEANLEHGFNVVH